jgi:hypothetical protein
MINPNKFANQKIQELGQNLFQGEEFAQQIANKQLDQPVPPPGPYGDINPIMNKDSREARRQERKNIRMANKGLRQARRERAKGVKEQGQENYSYDGYEKGRYNKKGDDIEYGKVKRYSKKNPPSGSDASFGISGYVNDKKQFKSALNQGTYTYKKGDLIDETDHEETTYKSSNEGKVTGKRYNVENVSDIQVDKKGQYMTTLGDDEYYGMDKRPTSSRVSSYDQGRDAVRDTLRPSKGRKFKSTWKKI